MQIPRISGGGDIFVITFLAKKFSHFFLVTFLFRSSYQCSFAIPGGSSLLNLDP
jgi:hypothetical protein